MGRLCYFLGLITLFFWGGYDIIVNDKVSSVKQQIDKFNHQVEIERGILEEECSQMLSEFFKELRRRKKGDKEHGKD